MFGKPPANPREADQRDASSRSVLPLVAAAILFGFGLVGLVTVLPYSTGASTDSVFVTSPSQSPEAIPTDVRVQEVASPATLIAEPTEQTVTQLPSTPEPTAATIVAPPSIAAVAVAADRPVELPPLVETPTPPPTEPPPPPPPGPTPTKPPPTPVPTEAPLSPPPPSPSPTPDFIADATEPGPAKPVEPVTAFFDPNFQQPAAEAPFGGGSTDNFPVTPGR